MILQRLHGLSDPQADEQLKDRNLVRVNLFREYDSETQRFVPCDPVLEGDWVYMVAVENTESPPS